MRDSDNIHQKLLNKRLTRSINADDINSVKFNVLDGANVNYRDEYNNTPLHSAALVGNIEIIAYLLRFRSDSSAVNSDGYTPVMLAERHGNDKVANYLAVVEAKFLYTAEKRRDHNEYR